MTHGGTSEARRGATILVVEDSPTQLERLRLVLAGAGFTVIATADGTEGLAAARAQPLDLVISDIVMPTMDGYELCRAIRDDEGLRDLPVILLSSLADPRDVIRGLTAGASNFICKPYEEQYLLARIQTVLANQRLRQSTLSEMGIRITFGGQQHLITSDRMQILDLLLSTYEDAVYRTTELAQARDELRMINEHLEERIAERTAALSAQIAERRQAEQELSSSEMRYRRLFKHAKDAILIADVEAGTIMDANRSARQLLGLTRAELLGVALCDLGLFADAGAAREAFARLQREPDACFDDVPLRTRSGRRLVVEMVGNVYLVDDTLVLQCSLRDVTARQRLQGFRDLQAAVLGEMDRHDTTAETARAALATIKQAGGLDAVGIRLRDGPDFPYLATLGFTAEFVAAERSVCARGPDGCVLRDPAGNAVLECLCGKVIAGRTDPRAPFFTAHGSFWTGESSALLARSSGQDGHAWLRARCNQEGYESVVLVPLRAGDKTLGLLQLCDRRAGAVTADDIATYEDLGRTIAMGLDRRESHRAERHGRAVAAAVAAATLDFLSGGDVRHSAGIAVDQAAQLCDAGLGALLDLDRKGAVRLRAAGGRELRSLRVTPEMQAVDEVLARDGFVRLPPGDNLLDAAIRAARPMLTNRPQEHPLWAGRQPAWLPRIDNLLVQPLVSDDCVLGVLALANRPGGFGESQQATVAALSTGAALILRAARGEEEKNAAQQQLLQAQRLESVGRLAGGVAHDFNNLLTVINSYTDFAIQGLVGDDQVREDLIEVRKAGDSAAALTRQLLAFSRRQVLAPVALDLNAVIADLHKMLRRVIGEDIELSVEPAEQLDQCRADPGQIEQVIMNLVVNARDAMPRGGRLRIGTGNAELYGHDAERRLSAAPGRYVVLSVSDDGDGMDEETVARVFEPFFTTKGEGKGTGLGLSTVYGIVKQSQGEIEVSSDVATGTTFRVYLPVAGAGVQPSSRRTADGVARRGSETILLVEDADGVRRMAQRILEAAGYRVLAAASGDEALRHCRRDGDAIHLLLTDVVMPHMGGRQLADQLARMCPAMKVLYMSGYADDAIARHGVPAGGASLVAKPFTAATLTTQVREVLDSGRDDLGIAQREPRAVS